MGAHRLAGRGRHEIQQRSGKGNCLAKASEPNTAYVMQVHLRHHLHGECVLADRLGSETVI